MNCSLLASPSIVVKGVYRIFQLLRRLRSCFFLYPLVCKSPLTFFPVYRFGDDKGAGKLTFGSFPLQKGPDRRRGNGPHSQHLRVRIGIVHRKVVTRIQFLSFILLLFSTKNQWALDDSRSSSCFPDLEKTPIEPPASANVAPGLEREDPPRKGRSFCLWLLLTRPPLAEWRIALAGV